MDIEIEAFTEGIAKISGEIYRELKRENLMIEFRDIFIEGTARGLGLPLITLNEKDFERIKGLELLKINDI